jgi:hypothetical protein
MAPRFSDVCPVCHGVAFHRGGCAVSHIAPTNQQLSECALAVLGELERRGNRLPEAAREIAAFHAKLVSLKETARKMGVAFAGDA